MRYFVCSKGKEGVCLWPEIKLFEAQGRRERLIDWLIAIVSRPFLKTINHCLSFNLQGQPHLLWDKLQVKIADNCICIVNLLFKLLDLEDVGSDPFSVMKLRQKTAYKCVKYIIKKGFSCKLFTRRIIFNNGKMHCGHGTALILYFPLHSPTLWCLHFLFQLGSLVL